MRLLITGGAGFIGSAVCRFLIGRTDAEILNLDKLTYAASPAALAEIADNPRYDLVRIDIADEAAVAKAFSGFNPDAVIHLAAETHVDRSIDDPDPFVATNIHGTFVLLKAALRYWSRLGQARDRFRFLHVSTDEVFGALDSGDRFRETTAFDPSSPYAASKAAADHLVKSWHRTYGLPTLIVNCSNNYGPYQFPEKLIPHVIANALEGRPLPIYGDGSNVRDWIFVDDHVRALWLVLTKGRAGERYLVGGAGGETTNLDLVRRICSLLDHRLPSAHRPHASLIEFVSDRPGHDRRYAVDTSKITAELDWKTEETLNTGLAKTVDWYLANRAWWQGIRESRYRGERLGTVVVP